MENKPKRVYDSDADEYKYVPERENINCSKILDNLYLGDFHARTDPMFNAIITLVSPPELRYISQTHPISVEHTNNVLLIPISDNGYDEIKPHIKAGIEFIDEHIKDKKVLVHCMAGISRSPSMVIAYLMSKGMPLAEAYWFVRDKRNIINPFSGFLKEIAEYFK